MRTWFLILVVICLLTSFIVQAQKAPTITPESLLAELGGMLTQTPTTPEGYQAAFERLKAWQAAKLEELANAKSQPSIAITSHKADQKVTVNPIVKGKVFNSNAAVWIIVHPMETEGYWVQPKATVSGNGEWYSLIYVGRPGKEDAGKFFEIRAVANPKKPLARGDVLGKWPEGEACSEMVLLIRE
jgi:hypothetical protein